MRLVMTIRPIFALIIAVAVACTACGESPTQPSEQPTPPVLAMRFSPDFIGPEPFTFWMSGSGQLATERLPVALNISVPTTCPVNWIQATVSFDPNVIRLVQPQTGPFLRQGGRTVSVTESVSTGRYTFEQHRFASGSSGDNVSGQGVFMTLHFSIAPAGLATATSAIRWEQRQANSFPGNDPCISNGHGGEITLVAS